MVAKRFVLADGNEIRITVLGKDDISQVWEIERSNFSEPWSERSFEEIIGAEFVVSLGAFDGEGVVLGYVMASFVVDTGEILNIAVSEKCKRMGIGSLLMDVAHAELEGKGVLEWFLEVRESNLPAYNLYLKKGYLPIGVRKNYYSNPKENAIVMKRNI